MQGSPGRRVTLDGGQWGEGQGKWRVYQNYKNVSSHFGENLMYMLSSPSSSFCSFFQITKSNLTIYSRIMQIVQKQNEEKAEGTKEVRIFWVKQGKKNTLIKNE